MSGCSANQVVLMKYPAKLAVLRQIVSGSFNKALLKVNLSAQ